MASDCARSSAPKQNILQKGLKMDPRDETPSYLVPNTDSSQYTESHRPYVYVHTLGQQTKERSR